MTRRRLKLYLLLLILIQLLFMAGQLGLSNRFGDWIGKHFTNYIPSRGEHAITTRPSR